MITSLFFEDSKESEDGEADYIFVNINDNGQNIGVAGKDNEVSKSYN